MVNRIIHQIWFDFSANDRFDGKDDWERVGLRDNILKTNPNYRYILWSFDDAKHFIKLHYPEYYTFICCKTNRPIIKCDFFRYLILFHFGGFYMDLDFTVIRNLDELIFGHNESKIILTRESHNCVEVHNTLHNGFMYSTEPHCLFFKNICDSIIMHNVASISEQDVYRITGTKLLCTFWQKYKDEYPIFVLPFHILCSHWFINSDNKRLLFDGENAHETYNSDTLWTFLTFHDAKKMKTTLIDNGAFAVCIVMRHGSYWK